MSKVLFTFKVFLTFLYIHHQALSFQLVLIIISALFQEDYYRTFDERVGLLSENLFLLIKLKLRNASECNFLTLYVIKIMLVVDWNIDFLLRDQPCMWMIFIKLLRDDSKWYICFYSYLQKEDKEAPEAYIVQRYIENPYLIGGINVRNLPFRFAFLALFYLLISLQ